MLGAVLGGLLEVLDHGVQLVDLRLEKAVLVLQGGDLLLLGEVVLLERLDLGGHLLDLLRRVVGLQTELVHFLRDGFQHRHLDRFAGGASGL